ncbi:MAG: phosphoketolase family protein, partial [Deltaproteobacteria bacterium]|nr:phosphoketolase family protein [Deltaproteobacteria bacterium]
EGDDPQTLHPIMADAVERSLVRIRSIQADARTNGFRERPQWPMIILRTPKGWTGPKTVDGKQVEGTFRSHQVPLASLQSEPAHLRMLEEWMRSYRPEELFNEHGALRSEFAALAPSGERRMSASLHANGGLLRKELRRPDFRDYAVNVPSPGAVDAEATRVQGKLIRDVFRLNEAERNFRVFSPDETSSNRWQDVFEVTSRMSVARTLESDDHVSPDGRVMEMLSEHQCQGWLEGYLLTGRHGFFSCYEAFIHIVDSMFNQHAKWLKTCRHLPWRAPIASLNYLLTSHVWRQDHNGFSHQDPGFIDHVVNKKAEIIRVYLPPDANTLLSVTDHCLKSTNLVNVIVAGKQSAPQWLSMEEAEQHCKAGIGMWKWASDEGEPDVVMACAGDVPTLETLAAVTLIRKHLPKLRVRVVNVLDLMKLQPPKEHPHGLTDEAFDALFTVDKPIVFAYHGYPWLIHRLTYRRSNHENLHVRGYKEEGTTTTPFDMTVLNDMDRFHLLLDVAERVPSASGDRARIREFVSQKHAEHRAHIRAIGDDLPEVRNWRWAR